MENDKLVGFPPIAGAAPRVMILGSMPGVESLKRRQYYGHPRNQFWEILESLLKPQKWGDYRERKETLKARRILLWDVVRSCRRNGSLDANLRDIKINDFNRLLRNRRSLKAVFCNGQTAFNLFKRHTDITLPVYALPSTSPAYTLPFKVKLARWRRIMHFIK